MNTSCQNSYVSSTCQQNFCQWNFIVQTRPAATAAYTALGRMSGHPGGCLHSGSSARCEGRAQLPFSPTPRPTYIVTCSSSPVRSCCQPCLNKAVFLGEVLLAWSLDIQQLICRGLHLRGSSYTGVTQHFWLDCSATVQLTLLTPALPPAVPSLQYCANAPNLASSRSFSAKW